MIFVIGEILIDRFPEYERIGGAPFNFAFHLKQLGLPVKFITRIGDDADGRHILHQLAEHDFDLNNIQIDTQHATGLVKVILDYNGVPQFDIRNDAAYDHIDLSAVPDLELPAGSMIYFGTLAQRTHQGFTQYQQFLAEKKPSIHRFCDINLRAPHLNREAIEASLHQTDILKLNSEELVLISKFYHGPHNPEELIAWVIRTFKIKALALTQGDKGSRIVTARESIYAAPKQVDSIVDTVGAGDAYAAILAAGLMHRLPLAQTLDLATDFAAQICSLPGATPEDQSVYQKLRQQLGKDTA